MSGGLVFWSVAWFVVYFILYLIYLDLKKIEKKSS